jgi:hypothetical protein
MRKPSFTVTTCAIVALALIGVFRVIYEPLLPPSPTEDIVSVPSSEPVPAPIVEINWRRTLEEGHAEAKRRKIGMFIFFIDPSSYYGKQLELDTLRDPEVARFINRNFAAVKVNLDQYPEWAQAILPIQRLGRSLEPGIDLVVTDSDGKLIDHYIIAEPFQFFGPEVILPFFIGCQQLLAKSSEGQGDDQNLQAKQSGETRALILAEGKPLPSFPTFLSNLRNDIKSTHDGVLNNGSVKFRPMAIQLLAKTGEAEFARSQVLDIVKSPLYDVLDGGFFREARTGANTLIDTSKSSTLNALSATVVAQLSCSLNDSSLMTLAKDIGDNVMTEFAEGDSICASRLNDEGIDLRSKRSSLTTKRLDAILTGDEINQFLRFATKQNSPAQDIASLIDLDGLADPEFKRIRMKLRQGLGYTPGLSEPDHIAVDGYVAARLFELFRYSKDERYLNKAKDLARQVYAAIGKDSLARIYGNRQLGAGWLGTYLSVADCGLANFAATGEIYALRNGEKALTLALDKFKDANTGLLFNAPPIEAGFAFTPSFPDLADRGREALNSQAIRLMFRYSIVSEDLGNRSKFLAFARSVLVRLNTVMENARMPACGYFDAAFDVIQNQSIVVSGPNRIDEANRLAIMFPFFPIYPLSVPNGKPKNEYFLREGEALRGPFSESEIRKMLRDAPRFYSE